MKTIRHQLLNTIVASAFAVLAVVYPPGARADEMAYLINVTVRPGYHFANAGDALDYGHDICGKVARGLPYGVIMGDVKSDFSTNDEYQASYLIAQSTNELCPALIWQLRNSTAGYRSLGH
jgi:Protein of unknown function (DUF732)